MDGDGFFRGKKIPSKRRLYHTWITFDKALQFGCFDPWTLVLRIRCLPPELQGPQIFFRTSSIKKDHLINILYNIVYIYDYVCVCIFMYISIYTYTNISAVETCKGPAKVFALF